MMTKMGIYFIGLVKTAHKHYLKEMLSEKIVARGEWNSVSGQIDGVDLLAVRFVDLQVKQFISTCSTSTVGPPRETKHNGFINRPQVAYDYLNNAAGIDIHNHVRTGSFGLKDVWMTIDPPVHQFAGVTGVMLTNVDVVFHNADERHVDFKMEAVNGMLSYNEVVGVGRRSSLLVGTEKTDDRVIKQFRDEHGNSKQRVLLLPTWQYKT